MNSVAIVQPSGASRRSSSNSGSAVRAPQPRVPRLGFIGLGWIGCKRLESVGASGSGEICGVADLMADARDAAGRVSPGAARVATLEELLDLGLDGVVIATPNALHAAQATAALQRGCAVFCQKPLGCNAVDVRRVIGAARAADRLLGVDLSYRHTAGMQAIRDLIRGGELGDIYAVETEFHNAYGPDKAWFYDKKFAGGGCLLDLGTHLIDMAMWCLDFPAIRKVGGATITNQVRADASTAVEDYASAQFVLESGTVVGVNCSWLAPTGTDAEISARFFGTKGGACFRNVNGSFYDFVAERHLPNRTRMTLSKPPDDWGGRAILAWARQLATAPEFDPGIEHLITVAEVLDTVCRSSA